MNTLVLNYLIENEILNTWINNFYIKYRNKPAEAKKILQAIVLNNGYDFFNNTLNWEETSQGHYFWENYNESLNQIIQKHENN